jgi:hypothetical protein
MDEINIKRLLEEFRVNKKAIEKLRSLYDINSILEVAFKEKMYDVILELFKPIEIDGEIKIYFDIFTYISGFGLFNFIDRFDVSDNEKDKIIKSIFNIDIEKMNKIKIGNTLPREISGYGHIVTDINDVIYYAEPACLETMIYLFNNNIRTTGNDTECVYGEKEENGKCTVRIDYDSLSEENKNIANYLISMNVAYFVGEPTKNNIEIQVPCSKNETVGAINEKLESIACQFVKQPILYGFFSREQILPKIIEWIKDDIVNDRLLPNGEGTYFEYCMGLIETEKVKENPNGDLYLGDGRTFLSDDFVNVILQSKEFFQTYIEYRGFYYDESEDKIWISEKLYKLYLKQMNINQQQIL